jgi:hypothetical protein
LFRIQFALGNLFEFDSPARIKNGAHFADALYFVLKSFLAAFNYPPIFCLNTKLPTRNLKLLDNTPCLMCAPHYLLAGLTGAGAHLS